MRPTSLWIGLVSVLVPADLRSDWVEEWTAELAARHGTMKHALGALADAWYLRTEGWTMDAMWRDVRTARNSLMRRPAFALLAGLTLAVGIGANTAIFSVVDGVLINPLPYPESHRLLSYNHEAPGLGVNVPVIPHSQQMYLHYLENARALEAFAVFSNDDFNLITDQDPRQVSGVQVTSQFFQALGLEALLGRTFADGEDRPGAERIVVLGHSLWREAFGEDREVIGRLVELDGVQRRVVGVMPAGTAFDDEEVWVPMLVDAEAPDGGSLGLIGVARLAEGSTLDDAQTEMQGLLERYAEGAVDDLPPGFLEQARMRADVKPLKDLFVQDLRDVLWVLLGTVGFVLLIACANVANLFLVRAEARQREQAVRTAMGASRLDVMRQYLTESVLLALGAGAVGLALGSFGVRGLLALAPTELPQALGIGIDGSVLAFTLAISLGTGLLFGLFPVLGYGRRDLSHALREGGRSSTVGKERHRARSGLVVAQVALALVLLVGSGLMLRSFVALRDVDLGFDPTDRLTFRFALPDAGYGEPGQVLDFQRRLTERLEAIPGVLGVGMIGGLPLAGSKSAGPMEPADRPFPEGQLAPVVERRPVTPGYLAAMAIEIVEGRALQWTDQGDQYRAVVVSEALARAFWPGEAAVGRMIQNQSSESPPWEVVGVARDVRFDGVSDEPLPMAYLPIVTGEDGATPQATSMDVVLHVSADPLGGVDAARAALRETDPRLPMINPRTVQSIVDDSLAQTSFAVLLLGIAAGIALLLGTVGIYGVVSYIVSRRTQEIGVRIALGAPAATVLRGVVGQGMTLIAIGLGVGVLGAWAMSRALGSLLYGVSATDPLTFVGTAALLAAIALLATWIPARRAARVDPVEALRAE